MMLVSKLDISEAYLMPPLRMLAYTPPRLPHNARICMYEKQKVAIKVSSGPQMKENIKGGNNEAKTYKFQEVDHSPVLLTNWNTWVLNNPLCKPASVSLSPSLLVIHSCSARAAQHSEYPASESIPGLEFACSARSITTPPPPAPPLTYSSYTVIFSVN